MVLGLKQTKAGFSNRFLKSLSQDAIEAAAVNLLKNWIKQVSQSAQRGSLVATILCLISGPGTL